MSHADAVLPETEPDDGPQRCEPVRLLSRRGGPRTPEGKARSRANAVKHGMTATTLWPEILRAGRVDVFRCQFQQELQPRTSLERVVVDELSRHAARLELGERAEEAVLRRGARRVAQLLGTCEASADLEEAGVCGAVATRALDQLTRYRASHEKGFFRALGALRDLRSTQPGLTGEQARREVSRPHFVDEIACEEFLRRRFECETWRCPRCSSGGGHWLPSRRCWECSRCRRQTGLRVATVMAGSPIALFKWFLAVELLLADPRISPAEVGRRIEINRHATVRSIMEKIRSAIASPGASVRLAGLDIYFGCPRST